MGSAQPAPCYRVSGAARLRLDPARGLRRGQVRTEHGSLVLLSQISSGGVDERAHHYLGRDRTAAVPAAEAPERRWRPLGTLERDGDPPRQPELLAVPSLEHQLGSGVEATNRRKGQQLLATGR